MLAATRELEDQGLLKRDPSTGSVVMLWPWRFCTCSTRRSGTVCGPGFSWDEACACCAVHGISDGELWASVDRLMVTGHLHAGPDFAHLKLGPTARRRATMTLGSCGRRFRVTPRGGGRLLPFRCQCVDTRPGA